MTNSMLENRSAFSLNLRQRYGVNLLAISRQGQRLHSRLDRILVKPGDVLLLQGNPQSLQETIRVLGCLPLVQRDLHIGQPKNMILAISIFMVAILAAGFKIMPITLAFSLAVVVMVVTKLVTLKEAYQSVDWPVIILIGTQIPFGEALELTGGAQLIADTILNFQNIISPVGMLILILVVTMGLSDLVKNAAAVNGGI